MHPALLISIFLMTLGPCASPPPQDIAVPDPGKATPLADSTLALRFAPPTGFTRGSALAGSQAEWLRALPLKPKGAPVLLYTGVEKTNQQASLAVVDLPIGKRDLHQCADAIFHLRARYLYDTGRKDEIAFQFTNGFLAEYARWRQGDRIRIEGNKTWHARTAAPKDDPETFWKYLETVFAYAGTLSLEKETRAVPLMEMRIGDVLVKGGSPGHAVLVADMALNTETGEKKFMLIQSYMPAQEAHVLKNPADGSAWYPLEDTGFILTPEWTFTSDQLRRYPHSQ